jgi:hypothetical protein
LESIFDLIYLKKTYSFEKINSCYAKSKSKKKLNNDHFT